MSFFGSSLVNLVWQRGRKAMVRSGSAMQRVGQLFLCWRSAVGHYRRAPYYLGPGQWCGARPHLGPPTVDHDTTAGTVRIRESTATARRPSVKYGSPVRLWRGVAAVAAWTPGTKPSRATRPPTNRSFST